MLGSWRHLAARFFATLRARPLSPDERSRVETWLRPGPERRAFWDQPRADQRHGLEAAETVDAEGGRRELVRAALLHDIGKRHANLGILGRVLASLALRLHLPVRGRWAAYRDHGTTGALELAAWSAEAVVVAYAGLHHDARPVDVPADDWNLLLRADGVT